MLPKVGSPGGAKGDPPPATEDSDVTRDPGKAAELELEATDYLSNGQWRKG